MILAGPDLETHHQYQHPNSRFAIPIERVLCIEERVPTSLPLDLERTLLCLRAMCLDRVSRD